MKVISAQGLFMIIMAALCFSRHPVKAQSAVIDTTYIDQLYVKSKAYWKKNDSSFFYLKQVEDLSRSINYDKGIAYALYGYGVNEHILYRQFEYYTKSLEIFERINDKFGIGLNLVKIGLIYSQIGQLEKSLEYYKQSLAVKKEINDYGGVALTLINIGKYYGDKNEWQQALQFFNEALVFRLKEGTHQGVAYAQVNISSALFNLNKIEDALEMADSAVYNFSLTKDAEGQVWSLSLKGKCLLALKKTKEAQGVFERVMLYPDRARYLPTTLSAKRSLINLYSEKGDWKKAFELQSEYVIAMDTLANRDYRTETQRTVNEYEFRIQEQKAEREKEFLEKKIARRNNLENLSIAIIVILLFVFLFSGRKVLSYKFVDGFLLIGLLLLFEFLLVLTDSSVEKITQGEPILKLAANVILALLILPGHRVLERYSRKKLIQYETD